MKVLRPGRYNHIEHRWVEHKQAPYDSTVQALTLVTYNVWFSTFAFPERSIALLHIIHQYGADLIGLQEVTSEFLKIVLEQDWVREGYFISIELLGTEPVKLEPQVVLPSDHFGLAARLQWSKPINPLTTKSIQNRQWLSSGGYNITGIISSRWKPLYGKQGSG